MQWGKGILLGTQEVGGAQAADHLAHLTRVWRPGAGLTSFSSTLSRREKLLPPPCRWETCGQWGPVSPSWPPSPRVLPQRETPFCPTYLLWNVEAWMSGDTGDA